jgi:hypothetical protein
MLGPTVALMLSMTSEQQPTVTVLPSALSQLLLAVQCVQLRAQVYCILYQHMTLSVINVRLVDQSKM